MPGGRERAGERVGWLLESGSFETSPVESGPVETSPVGSGCIHSCGVGSRSLDSDTGSGRRGRAGG